MPPPMPNPTKRMTANPAKPVGRYRPGKAVAEQESSEEEEESEEEQQQQPQSQRTPQARPTQAKRPQAPVQEESEEEDEDEEGFVTDPEDAEETPAPAGSQPARTTSTISRPPAVKQDSTQARSEEESEEDESDEASEEEEESSSEEEAPQRKFQRPTFIKKTERKSAPTDAAHQTPDAEVEEQSRRLAQADLLIKDKLERDALARAQGKKAWDDDDDVLPESMVDDTDGVDPEAEYAAWKVRELKRLKRDREALVAREKEIEETERRRNLTAEEREKEDKEYLDKQREEREGGRSEAQFLARYHHKGAFFQGDETAEILKRRDVMGARFEDDVTDKSVLPEYMRLRDMTKLGKKGRTRYTDLKGQDTGRFGEDVKRWRGSGGGPSGGAGEGFDTRGLDERFLPDDQRGGGNTGPTGATASAVGQRREKESYRDGDRGERRKRSHSRSRSRSRSPRRRKRESDYDLDRDRRREIESR
ncbi:splicing factor, Prp19-binding domain-containing protein [Exophiala viscosa]|uniref:Splicing factor, Prp19-binding domain-containing protein n=1 Tax=Exophiala viscosa TaxID=2486360 RepID=A0AAN6DRW0_9EURO|nr:splicing factor, Prp19-binding domain-containing protein [Exophiala viscosa]